MLQVIVFAVIVGMLLVKLGSKCTTVIANMNGELDRDVFYDRGIIKDKVRIDNSAIDL